MVANRETSELGGEGVAGCLEGLISWGVNSSIGRVWVHGQDGIAVEEDLSGSEQGSNVEVWLKRPVSAGRSVCVGGGRLRSLLVIGCMLYVAKRGCVAGVAWVGTLC